MNSLIMNQAYLRFGFSQRAYLEIIVQPNLVSPKTGMPVLGYNSISRDQQGGVHITIVLNSSTNQTNESIYATILHEMTHAYLSSENILQDEYENQIATPDFIADMKYSILTLSPSFNPFNAYALAWAGLQNSNLFLSQTEDMKRDIINAIARQEAGNEGSRCQINVHYEQN